MEQGLVFGCERARLGALKIKHADEAVLQEKRYDQFRAHFDAMLAEDIARVFAHIGYADNAALAGGASRKTLIQRDAHGEGDGILVLQGKDAFEVLRRFIPKHDAEDIEVHQGFDAVGNAAEELFAIEDGGELAADVVEQGKRAAVFGKVGENGRRDRISVADGGKASEFPEFVHGVRPGLRADYHFIGFP